MIIVTGGAGFIGSNLVAALEEAGEQNLVVCDHLRDGNKWRNISKRAIDDLVLPEDLEAYIAAHAADISCIFHMGAISSTIARDGDLVVKTNFALSVALWKACARYGITFIYASSAATYGDGANGFSDSNEIEKLQLLRPLNLYGWSKWLFDAWVLRAIASGAKAPPIWAGLRFFNVFGPNEYHKGNMQSLISKIIAGHVPGQSVTLFKSHRDGVGHGEQSRDFICVHDVVDVMLWLRLAGKTAGILNLGTGLARSFKDLAKATIRAAGEEPQIDYVDMPASILNAYQYYTCADMTRLRRLGYDRPFSSLESAITHYVKTYLLQSDPYR